MTAVAKAKATTSLQWFDSATAAAATAAKATVTAATAATAAAAKAKDDNDDGGGNESDGNGNGDGDGSGSRGGGSDNDDDDNDDDDDNVSNGGSGSGGGNDDDDDGDDDDDDGNNNRLARNDRIDGVRRGPPAPRGRTAVALSLPSSQAPSAKANATLPKQVALISTNAPTYVPSSSVEDGGMTAPLAPSSLAAMVAPDATSTVAAGANGNTDDILCKS